MKTTLYQTITFLAVSIRFFVIATLFGVFAWTILFSGQINAQTDETTSSKVPKAVIKGNLEQVKQLVEEDPILVIQDYEYQFDGNQSCTSSLLHIATYSNQLAIVKYLLEQGADPTVKNGDNFTPIFFAAAPNIKGDEMILYLLANGSNMPMTDCVELSPFQQGSFKMLTALGDRDAGDLERQVRLERLRLLETITNKIKRTEQGKNVNDYKLQINTKPTKTDFYKKVSITESKWTNSAGKEVHDKDSIQVKDEDLENIAESIPTLKWMSIMNDPCKKITDDGLKHIAKLTRLKSLSLNINENITDDGLKYLSGISGLEYLHLGSIKNITDSGLEYLMQMKNLKSVNLVGYCPNITESGIARLQEALPQCKITSGVKKKENVNSKSDTTKSDTVKTETTPSAKQDNKPDAMELMMGIAFGDIGDKSNDNKTVTELLNESAEEVLKQHQSKNNNNLNDNPVTGKTTNQNEISNQDAALTLYMKVNAGFEDKEVTVKNLLKFGTAELMQKTEELNGKLRNADAFDKAEIEKQIKITNDIIETKLKEIKNKIFYQDYSYSPYDFDVKVNGYMASFPIYITKDFYLIAKSIKLRSPFSDVTSEILDNKYSIADTAVANTTGGFLPKWEKILVSGNAESIKKLVREKDKYRIRVWFKNLHGEYNEEVRMTSLNAFAPVKKITTLIPFAELISVEIFDRDNPPPTWLTADSSEVEKDNSDHVEVAKKTTEQPQETTITEINSAPPLDNPDEWLKPLRELQKDDIQPVINVQRFCSLLEFADAAQDKEHYRTILKEFFDALKSIDSPTQRIQFIFDVLPTMYSQNNFEGLKDAAKRINTIMEKRNYDNYEWKKSCAILAAFSIISGDNASANGFIDTGRLNQGGKTKSESIADNADVFIMTWYIKAITRQPMDLQEIKNADKKVNSFSKNNVFLMAGLSRHLLTERENRKAYTDFQGILKKLQGYEKSCAYHFGIADAILGNFDEARIHWKQYDNYNLKPWPQELFAFIVRQEFLSGQFGGYEEMQQDKNNIENLRNKTTKFRDNELWNMSNVVSAFYFDYGRGFGRHKSEDEIIKEGKTLMNMFKGNSKYGDADLAFFMAGVVTGLQDKKNPKENKISSNLIEEKTQPATNNDEIENVFQLITEQQPQIDQPETQKNVEQPRTTGSRLERGIRTYQKAKSIIDQFGVPVRLP
ncbi:MAG: ankyrin repeat domain-containing protein [Planctomycetaceae bacterium]|jgi:hypothetical protein|nr:ankyrin repeat domain-containing protein [Planctomycetaceae bacterium]